VKPDITFFGERLPMNMYQVAQSTSEDTDLLIIIGTSLSVAPFNKVVDTVDDRDIPKVLINLENTDLVGYDFDDKHLHPERLFLQGHCQDIILEIAEECGWKE